MTVDITKRYFIFAFDNYYPCGGFGDYVFSVDSLEELIEDSNKKDDKEYQTRIDIINSNYYCQYFDSFTGLQGDVK
jgi:hypothetical protein